MTRGRHARPTRGLGMADEPALPNSAARWRFTRALPRQAPPPGGGAPAAEQGAAAAGDSITVATWPIVSRVTGVAKFACIGAVLRFAAMAGRPRWRRLGQPGPFPGLVDGHEATELHPANNVSVTADPS